MMKKKKYRVIIYDGKRVYNIESASRNARKHLREYNAIAVSVYASNDKGTYRAPVSFAEARAVKGKQVILSGAVK